METEGTKIEVRKIKARTLREVTVKIRLERIDMQEGITIKALLDNGATGLVMSSEFAKKQRFKLKRLERLMYIRNMNRSLNKEGPIEYIVEVNIYYQGHRERTEIDVIGGQKLLQSVPSGESMYKGKEYDDNDQLYRSSLSQRLI